MPIETNKRQEHLDAVTRIGIWGGVTYSAGCGATAFGLSLLAQKYSPRYRLFAFPFKAFLVTMSTAAGFGYGAERKIMALTRSEMGIQDRPSSSLQEFVHQHRPKLFVGTFAGAGLLGWLFYRKNQNMPSSAKTMNIRLYAQAVAVGTAFLLVWIGATKDPENIEANNANQESMQDLKKIQKSGVNN